MNNNYDVVIIGGGTAGVSCAWNCGKLGLKTLIIEQNGYLGGSITGSLVIPAMKTSKNSINNDFFNALYEKLINLGGAITYSDGNKGWFNPELTKIALDMLMEEAGVEVLFESHVTDIKQENNKILSICVDTLYNDNANAFKNKLLLYIVSKYYIDGTGDGNFCKKLNCEILEKFEDNSQPISLRFIMSGVNVCEFSKWLMAYDTDRDVTTSCTVGGYTYLSTAYTWDSTKWALKPLFERAIADGYITEEDSNYFQLFSVAGTPDSIAFNCPRIINSNLTRSEAYIQGRASILRLSRFCKKYLPGFKNAHISSIANSLGVRVSNRIRGKYVYTYKDLISGKTFNNPVLISNYPVDVHSDKKGKSELIKTEQEYQLPLESLMSADYDNLFIIGRCISADFKAQAALRIIPSCFSMGEGLAKYLA